MTITQSARTHLKLISETTASEMILDSYVMQRSRQRCLHCDTIEAYSTIFEVWTHPTKTRTTGVRSLRVFVGTLKKLPLAIVDLPERTIPTCYDCVEDFETEGEKPIAPVSRESWEATLRRKYTPEPSRSDSAPKHVPTLESL